MKFFKLQQCEKKVYFYRDERKAKIITDIGQKSQWNYLAFDIVKEIWKLLYQDGKYTNDCSNFRLSCKLWSMVFDVTTLEKLIIYPVACTFIISRRKRKRFLSYKHLSSLCLEKEFPNVTTLIVDFKKQSQNAFFELGDFTQGIRGLFHVKRLELINLSALHNDLVTVIKCFPQLKSLRMHADIVPRKFEIRPAIEAYIYLYQFPPTLTKMDIECSETINSRVITLPEWFTIENIKQILELNLKNVLLWKHSISGFPIPRLFYLPENVVVTDNNCNADHQLSRFNGWKEFVHMQPTSKVIIDGKRITLCNMNDEFPQEIFLPTLSVTNG